VDPRDNPSVLHRVPLFSELDPGEFGEIVSLARPISFGEGQTIFRQGEEADGMYVIEHGRVRISERVLGEDEVELTVLGPGDVLGEFSLVDRGVRSATARAMEPSGALFFSCRHFEVLRTDLRPAAFKTMRRISRELFERLRSGDHDIDTRSGAVTSRALPSWVNGPSSPLGDPLSTEILDRRLLRVLPFFRSLTPDETEEFLSLLTAWQVPKGRVFFRQGTAGTSCFLVARGAVQAALEKGTSVVNLAVLGPGKIFGLSLIEDRVRTATCYAREHAVVFEIGREAFEHLFEGSTSIAFKFFETLNETLIAQLRGSNRQLSRLTAQEQVPGTRR
jgi:CRP/FNR family transcriptional regulator, cyclic AMP receptor protein